MTVPITACLTPGGRATRRPGVAFGALLACSLAVACDSPPVDRPGPTLELNGETVRLEQGASIHDIAISMAEPERIEPAAVEASPGDALRFIAEDTWTHAIAFDDARLAEDGRVFLAGTDQLRGPPLVNPGATWVVSLADAPPGDYPFTCLTHGGRGVVRVATP